MKQFIFIVGLALIFGSIFGVYIYGSSWRSGDEENSSPLVKNAEINALDHFEEENSFETKEKEEKGAGDIKNRGGVDVEDGENNLFQIDESDELENYATEEEGSEIGFDLIDCLAEAGVVIYGSVTCPFCTQLAESLGGYDAIDPIYVECPDDPERCEAEMYGRGVPEIQIEGEFYQGSRDPVDLAEAVGCERL